VNNILINGLPNAYKGYSLNTGFKTALSIMELLDDPRLNKNSERERLAAYIAAISILFKDQDVFAANKLGLDGAINGLMWWLNCGNDDKVVNYWKSTGIAPDIDDNAFDICDYNKPATDIITIEKHNGEKTEFVDVTRYSVLSFEAPDGTTRYMRRANGEPDLISLYEDADLIYSGFIRVFGIDLAVEDIHWFKFSLLLAELETVEGTLLANKIKLRSFDSSDYQGKEYAKYRGKMEQAKSKNRVLGILPYIDKGE
jgi:hypothetical protein